MEVGWRNERSIGMGAKKLTYTRLKELQHN